MKDINNGSVGVLWRISFPLMVSFFSSFSMLFVDRLFLAKYSHEALTASASGGTLAWGLIFGPMTVAAMAEIFIAQHNGAKHWQKLGAPMWQMIYYSLLTTFLYIPIAYYFGDHLGGFEGLYFSWVLYFAPTFLLVAALQSFLIGQGKTSIIKWLGILGNGVNVILDPLFIFGWEGVFPAYGIPGAAVATGLGQIIQILILIPIVFSLKNRTEYGTGNYRFQAPLFWKILKVATPSGIFITGELLGWSAFYWMMSRMSELHILVASVTQSVLVLFLFFGCGLEKGVAAIAGNLIGSKNTGAFKQLLVSSAILVAIYAVFLFIAMIGFPGLFLGFFNLAANHPAIPLIKFSLFVVAIYITLENMRWIISGILTAAGDTNFLMLSGTLLIWVSMVLPIYLFVYLRNGSITECFYIWIIYCILALVINYARFKQGKWKTKKLIDDGKPEAIPSSHGGSGQSSVSESD
ncbi:MAG: MATE family efflux transporter [Simkaniaceae bacterium]|nr:MATE family efflux transporter [Simkaniaceae bacterium]